MKHRFYVLAFLLICTLLVNCARRGSPSGGQKDEIPPVLIKAMPEVMKTNFNSERIRLYFDEYIVLKNLRKQLIISPPLDPAQYLISPQSGASKFIQIDLDSLSVNTTYTFNFGQSIVDNNEGNPYAYFKYVFSTGDYIDSLSVQGTLRDAISRKADNFVSVMLYAIDSTFTDSIIYQKPPTYFTNTLDSLIVFDIENVKAGQYLLVAQKDISNNYVFDQKVDKIGFHPQIITVPSEMSYDLTLFQEEPNFSFGRAFQAGKNRIGFGFEGNPNGIQINLDTKLGRDAQFTQSLDREKDSIYFWYKNIKQDSLQFTLTKDTLSQSYTHRVMSVEADSLSVEASHSRSIDLEDVFFIKTSTPISSVNKDLFSLVNKDSVQVDFETRLINPHELQIQFELLPNDAYKIQALPNAFVDFYDATHDTLQYFLKTKSRVDYGNIRLRINNIPSSPFFIDIMDDKEIIERTQYITEPRGQYSFMNLPPKKYFVRVRIDENSNGVWDSGNFLLKEQAEAVYHFPALLDVRANWELQETFTLK